MILNKFVTYLYYVGCVFLGIGVVGKMLIRFPFLDFLHKNVFIYISAIGIFMMVPSWVYKLYHFNMFKNGNKKRLLTFALVIVSVLMMIFIVRGV
jgi:hypothetical protein